MVTVNQYYSFVVTLICAQYSQEQLYLVNPTGPDHEGAFYTTWDEASSTFQVYYFIYCGYDVLEPHDERFVPLTLEDNQHKYLTALYVWLDLNLSRYVIGALAILVGIFLCTLNYQSPNTKYRHIAQYLISCIACIMVIGCVLYLTVLSSIYSMWLGWIVVATGFLVGNFCFLLIYFDFLVLFTI